MEVSQKLICMAKVQNFSGITPDLPFTEHDFYDLYRKTFENGELGRIKQKLPLQEMAESFGLTSKSMRPRRGRRPYFTPEGKVALMFLKMYTGPSGPKLNGAVEREHPSPAVLRREDRFAASADELQAAG